MHDNIISAFRQVGIHVNLVDRANTYSRVAYTDPSTARLVVEKYGVIPLPEPFQTEPPQTWQLKIRDLDSRYQTERAEQLRLELAAIRDELDPPEQRSAQHRTHPQGTPKSRPPPPSAGRRAPPRPAGTARPPRAGPSSKRPPLCVQQSRLSSCTHSHSEGGFEFLPGSGDSPQTVARNGAKSTWR